MRFEDQEYTCSVDTPVRDQKQTRLPSTKVYWLFDKLSNNASDDGLSLSASVAVNIQILKGIHMPGNNAILMAYQINTISIKACAL